MDQESLDEFESQLAARQNAHAPSELRLVVLGNVDRELRASRWDRRLARAAVLLLVVGVGMNVSLALIGSQSNEPQVVRVASDHSEQSLVETAIVIAEATDAETGRRFARQLAALSGRELTDQEIEAISAAAKGGRG